MTTSANFEILLADDDAPLYGLELECCLKDFAGAVLSTASSPASTLELAAKKRFDLILLDITFNGFSETGLCILPRLKKIQPDAEVIMLSSIDDEKTLIRALELGATDFISKATLSMKTVVDYIKAARKSEDVRALDEARGIEIAAKQGITFKSESMRSVYRLISSAQRCPKDPVLIFGETGSGKEVVASAIAKVGRPFVTVDCGALTESLAESVFFGHEKGSFTGADAARVGLFKMADGGDLFLDEIGNLKPAIQEKLLRAIQTQEVTPIGGRSLSVKVRIIAATNEDLDSLVRDGLFRQDLYERLKGICVRIPPLRDRTEDFDSVVSSILRHLEAIDVTVTPTCLALLRSYDWPGNVRELKSIVLSMLRSSGSKILSIQNLPQEFRVKVSENATSRGAEQYPVWTCELQGTSNIKAAEREFRGKFIESVYRCLPAGATKTELASTLGITRFTLAEYLDEMGEKAVSLGLEVKRKGEADVRI